MRKILGRWLWRGGRREAHTSIGRGEPAAVFDQACIDSLNTDLHQHDFCISSVSLKLLGRWYCMLKTWWLLTSFIHFTTIKHDSYRALSRRIPSVLVVTYTGHNTASILCRKTVRSSRSIFLSFIFLSSSSIHHLSKRILHTSIHLSFLHQTSTPIINRTFQASRLVLKTSPRHPTISNAHVDHQPPPSSPSLSTLHPPSPLHLCSLHLFILIHHHHVPPP